MRSDKTFNKTFIKTFKDLFNTFNQIKNGDIST